MMTGLVIDTHVLIWYVFDLNRLSDTALTRLDHAVNNNELIYVSSISLIEIIYLVSGKRTNFPRSIKQSFESNGKFSR